MSKTRSTVNEPASPLLSGRASEGIGFLWGLAEATLFFVIPDVFFTLVAVFSLRQSARVLAAVLCGAVVGGSILYVAGQAAPGESQALVLKVPFVRSSMLAKTHNDLERSGIWTMVKGPRFGVPYKIYAVQGSRYAGWPLFLLVTIVARMERFIFVWMAAAAASLVFRRFIARRPRVAVAIHGAFWIGIYAWYWSTI